MYHFRLLALLILGQGASAASHGVILQYHHISNQTPAATSLSPEDFNKQMDYLAKHKFTVMPLSEMIDRLQRRQQIADKSVAITFDDGYRSVFHQALPILKKHGWPFTVFINTKPIQEGSRIHMNWQQLQAISKAKGEIANHTVSHPHLVRLAKGESNAAWRQRISQEIQLAQQLIGSKIGSARRFLAYPYGEYHKNLSRLIKDLNYVGLAQHSGPVSFDSDFTALPRFAFSKFYRDMDAFAIKAASLPLPLTSDNYGMQLLDKGNYRPSISFTTKTDLAITCFASTMGQIPVTKRKRSYQVRSPKNLPIGRSRYNCTAPAGDSRYYWHSWPFMRKNLDGSWYKES